MYKINFPNEEDFEIFMYDSVSCDDKQSKLLKRVLLGDKYPVPKAWFEYISHLQNIHAGKCKAKRQLVKLLGKAMCAIDTEKYRNDKYFLMLQKVTSILIENSQHCVI